MVVRSIERRGMLAPAWADGFVRVGSFLDLKRWLPNRPSWREDYGPSMETPLALSYVASWLNDAGNAAWSVVFDEYCCFLAAA